MSLALTQVSSADLGHLAAALESGALQVPLSAPALSAAGYAHLYETLQPFAALDRPALLCVLDAVLAERASSRAQRLELVWSGSDAGSSLAKYTRIVVPELLDRASRSVSLAGYSFDQGQQFFEPLHRAILERSVSARLFVDIRQLHARLEQQLRGDKREGRLLPVTEARATSADAYAHAVVDLFWELFWPFPGTKPELYYDPRSAAAFGVASLHAKCLVVDHEQTLITSANFTERGQERNIEVGVLIRDKGFANALERQWFNLIRAKGVVRWV